MLLKADQPINIHIKLNYNQKKIHLALAIKKTQNQMWVKILLPHQAPLNGINSHRRDLLIIQKKIYLMRNKFWYCSLCHNFFHLLALLAKYPIYSNKFFHNFHLSESSFTCPCLWASGLARKLILTVCQQLDTFKLVTSS